MIDLDDTYLREVKHILATHVPEVKVRAFGSRVNKKALKYSDLDLALIGEETLDWRRIEALKDAFSESNLPIMVDALDWHAISPEFRRVIEKECEVIQEGILGHDG